VCVVKVWGTKLSAVIVHDCVVNMCEVVVQVLGLMGTNSEHVENVSRA